MSRQLERSEIGFRKVGKIMPKYVEKRSDDFGYRTHANCDYDRYAVKNPNIKPRINPAFPTIQTKRVFNFRSNILFIVKILNTYCYGL